MQFEHLEKALFQLLCAYLPYRSQHLSRLATICSVIQLARSCQFEKLIRYMNNGRQKASNHKFIKRCLDSFVLTPAMVYEPLVKAALTYYQAPRWHIVIDRTHLGYWHKDLIMTTLSYRKRAIPLAWQLIPYGSSNHQHQIELLERTAQFLPENKSVIIHGDAEFGSVDTMDFIMNKTPWDFILGQRKSDWFQTDSGHWHQLQSLEISKYRPFFQMNVLWTKSYQWGPVHFFAFFAPYRSEACEPKRDFRYCTTSLLSSRSFLRLGRRRWGIEPMFKDFKSAGFHMHHSAITDEFSFNNLLGFLAINYLWATSTGVWLCKSGRRRLLDSKKNGILASSALA